MNEGKVTKTEEVKLNTAIKLCNQKSFGVVEHSFLCQSVSILEPGQPVSIPETCTVSDAISLLQLHNLGCVLVVNQKGQLSGIFTERDCILKVLKSDVDKKKELVSSYMTPNPAAEEIDITVAYALSMMSQGGFRHLPLVDKDKMPVGVISVKDIVDYIATSTFNDMINFEPE